MGFVRLTIQAGRGGETGLPGRPDRRAERLRGESAALVGVVMRSWFSVCQSEERLVQRGTDAGNPHAASHTDIIDRCSRQRTADHCSVRPSEAHSQPRPGKAQQSATNSGGGGGLTLVVSEVKCDLGVVCEGDKEKSSAVENQYFSLWCLFLSLGL